MQGNVICVTLLFVHVESKECNHICGSVHPTLSWEDVTCVAQMREESMTKLKEEGEAGWAGSFTQLVCISPSDT